MGTLTCTSKLLFTLDGVPYLVPCRRCPRCQERRCRAWMLRLYLESFEHESTSFVTLTYNDATVTDRLQYQDISLFMKRFRKSSRKPVRFFCAGEYGSENGRPHWHLIVYTGAADCSQLSVSIQWPHGFVKVAPVQHMGALKYVAGYSLKGGLYSHLSIVRMSNRPGLGTAGCYRLGKRHANYVKTIDCVPFWARVKGAYFPLDDTAQKYWLKGYLESGGLVSDKLSNLARRHYEAELWRRAGDPVFDSNSDLRVLNLAQMVRDKLNGTVQKQITRQNGVCTRLPSA